MKHSIFLKKITFAALLSVHHVGFAFWPFSLPHPIKDTSVQQQEEETKCRLEAIDAEIMRLQLILALKASAQAAIKQLEYEREHPTVPPVLHALQWNKYDDFYKLVQDPATDVNIMDDQRSLLHFVAYRCTDSQDKEGIKLAYALLERPDLKLDQKGNGIGDDGRTTLDMLISHFIFFNAEWNGEFYKIEDVNRTYALLQALLEKGANPECIGTETAQKLKKELGIDLHQLKAVFLPHEISDQKLSTVQSCIIFLKNLKNKIVSDESNRSELSDIQDWVSCVRSHHPNDCKKYLAAHLQRTANKTESDNK